MLPHPADTARDLLAVASLCHIAGHPAAAANLVTMAGELLAGGGSADDIPARQRERRSG